MPFPHFLRKNRRWLLAAVFLTALRFGGASTVQAETTAELVEKLHSAIVKETAATEAGFTANPRDPEIANKRTTLAQLRGLRQRLSSPNSYENDTFDSVISQINDCPVGESIHKLCADILAQARAERASRTAEASGLLIQLPDTVLKAAAPKDLDGLLQNLNAQRAKFSRSLYSYGSQDRQDAERLQQAVGFVSHWQDYLSARAADNPRTAVNVLRDLIRETTAKENTFTAPFVPRSELLARQQQLQQTDPEESDPAVARRRTQQAVSRAREILGRIKTLDDVAPNLTELDGLTSVVTSSDSYLGYSMRQLHILESRYRSFKAGLPANFNPTNLTNDGEGDFGNEMVSPLTQQFFAIAMPHEVGLAEDTIKPTPGEPVDHLLRRLMDAAKKRGDWPALGRAVEISRNLNSFNRNTVVLSTTDLEAYRNFFAGWNQEQAGQWTFAVALYHLALSSGSLEMPSDFIGGRLDGIRRDHPKEYENGIGRFNGNPATNVYWRSNPSEYDVEDMRSYRGDPRRDGRAPMMAMPVPEATPNPAATPAAVPAASPASVPVPAASATPSAAPAVSPSPAATATP